LSIIREPVLVAAAMLEEHDNGEKDPRGLQCQGQKSGASRKRRIVIVM